MKTPYIPRLFDTVLKDAMSVKGAVLITGTKWCGKTRTCENLAKTVVSALDPLARSQSLGLLRANPDRFFETTPKPILFDEWQVAPYLWDLIRQQVDADPEPGQYLLTGSVTDALTLGGGREERAPRHSGIGRITARRMRTMSLLEAGEGDGLASISSLRDGSFRGCTSRMGIDGYAFAICRGGWPLALVSKEDRKRSLSQAPDYLEMLVQEDIFRLADVPLRKDPDRAMALMRSLARNVGTECRDKTLMEDTGMGPETLEKYLLALRRLYVLEDLSAWNPNLRSKTAIRTSPVRHFSDPSIAASALGLSPEGLYSDMRLFGFLFESLAVHELRVYGDVLGARLYHYRDKRGREADAVLVFRDGTFGLFEVKLGDDRDVEEGAHHLLAIASDLKEAPSFSVVLTKGPWGYQREDGVHVVPLACLCP